MAKTKTKSKTSKTKKSKRSEKTKTGSGSSRNKSTREGMTNPAIIRLLKTGGVKLQKREVYETVTKIYEGYLSEVVRQAVLPTVYHKRSTVRVSDVTFALESLGIEVAHPTMFDKVKCDPYGNKKKDNADGEDAAPKKTRKTKKGSASLKHINYFQKQNGKLYAAIEPFRRSARKYAVQASKEFGGEKRIQFNEQALRFLQYLVENFLINLLSDAYDISENAGRATLAHTDILLAQRLRRSDF
jgi:histone H3/H4